MATSASTQLQSLSAKCFQPAIQPHSKVDADTNPNKTVLCPINFSKLLCRQETKWQGAEGRGEREREREREIDWGKKDKAEMWQEFHYPWSSAAYQFLISETKWAFRSLFLGWPSENYDLFYFTGRLFYSAGWKGDVEVFNDVNLGEMAGQKDVIRLRWGGGGGGGLGVR